MSEIEEMIAECGYSIVVSTSRCGNIKPRENSGLIPDTHSIVLLCLLFFKKLDKWENQANKPMRQEPKLSA